MLAPAALLSLLALCQQAQAWFVLQQTPLISQRIDPIVNPGQEAAHVHSFVGVNTIQKTTSLSTLESAECTGSGVAVDKSAYWAPTLYAFDPAKKEFKKLKNTFTNTYYFNRLGPNQKSQKIQAYPKGLRFLSGESKATDFTADTRQQISFECLLDVGQGSIKYQTLPSTYDNCKLGLRLQIHLKSCYDGKPLDMNASDHSAHMAWAGAENNGDCDPKFPVRLPSQFHEWVFDVQNLAPGSQLVLSNGDTVGYTFHVDFISAWDTTVLANAMNDASCNDAGFDRAKCAPLKPHLQDDATKSACPAKTILSVTEEIEGPMKGLPGCNRILNGPNVGQDTPNACAPPLTAKYASNTDTAPVTNTWMPAPTTANAMLRRHKRETYTVIDAAITPPPEA